MQLRRWEKIGGNSHRLVESPTSLGSFTLDAGMGPPVTLRLPETMPGGR